MKNVPFDKLSLLDQNYKFIFCLFLPQCASAHFKTPWLSRVIFQTAIGVNWRVARWICNISDLRPLQSSCIERFLTTNCRDFKSWNHPKICIFFSNTRHTKSWLCYFSKFLHQYIQLIQNSKVKRVQTSKGRLWCLVHWAVYQCWFLRTQWFNIWWEISQSNWSERWNGGPDRLPAFNQLDIRQDEAFITPHLQGRRGMAGHKEGQFDLDELFRVSGLAQMSFRWDQPSQQECFQVTLIAPPPIKPCQKGRREEESCRSLPQSSSVMTRVAGGARPQERWAISEFELMQKMLILVDKGWGNCFLQFDLF